MHDKFPETEVIDPSKEIIVAPGEGQKPSNILQDIVCDIKVPLAKCRWKQWQRFGRKLEVDR